MAFEKLATFALNLAGIWAIVTMITDAFEFADRDYDMNNPRGSYRYTRAHFVVCTSPEKTDTEIWLTNAVSGLTRTLHFIQGRNPA